MLAVTRPIADENDGTPLPPQPMPLLPTKPYLTYRTIPCLVTFTDLKTRRVGLSASAELLVIDRRHQGGKCLGLRVEPSQFFLWLSQFTFYNVPRGLVVLKITVICKQAEIIRLLPVYCWSRPLLGCSHTPRLNPVYCTIILTLGDILRKLDSGRTCRLHPWTVAALP